MRARWLFFLVLTLFSLTLIGGALLVVVVDYSRTVAILEARANEAVRGFAVQIKRNIAELNLGIEWLARRVDPRAPDFGLSPDTVVTAQLIAQQLPGLSALVVVDAAGRLRFSTASQRSVGTDVSYRDYFIAARDRNVPIFIGPTVRAEGTQRLVYTVSKRLESDGFAGVVLASALAERWNGIIGPLVPVPGTRIRLLRPDGAPLVEQVRVREGLVVATPDGPSLPPAAKDQFVARLRITDYPVVAEIAVPRQAALANWHARRNFIIVGAVLGLVALSVFGVLGYRTLGREAAAVATAKRRAQELEARTADLDRALETRNLLMAELEHRVKNSLGLAASMLQLQKTHSAEGGDVRMLLDTARARILAIARVHDRLNEGGNPSAVAFDAYLRGLCADMAASAGFRHTVEADSVLVPTARAVHLGLIATELLLNAAKHGARDGEIRVEVAAHVTGNSLVLSIRDFGTGLPPGFDPRFSSGLGMRVVSSLVGQLDGTLSAENANPGARITVRVSLELRRDDPAAAGASAGEFAAVRAKEAS